MGQHRELLKADVVISADGAMWRIDEPSLNVANRGLAALELTLTGPEQGPALRGGMAASVPRTRCTPWPG